MRNLILIHLHEDGSQIVMGLAGFSTATNSEFAAVAIADYWRCDVSRVDTSNIIDAHESGIHHFDATGGTMWRQRGTFRLLMEPAA